MKFNILRTLGLCSVAVGGLFTFLGYGSLQPKSAETFWDKQNIGVIGIILMVIGGLLAILSTFRQASARSRSVSTPRGTLDTDSISQIERLAKLREAGALTQEEFEAQKVAVLSRARPGDSA